MRICLVALACPLMLPMVIKDIQEWNDIEAARKECND